MMVVKFVLGMSPYQAGEIAGFDEVYAQKLINRGIAEEYKTKIVDAPPADKMVDGDNTENKEEVKRTIKPQRK